MALTKRHIDVLWPCLLVSCIFLVSGTPKLAAPDVQLYISKDKLAHFLVFGLLATSIIRISAFKRRKFFGAVAVALMVSLYGGLDEWHQSFTPNRSVEFADWIADSVGASVAVFVYTQWTWYRNLLEKPVLLKKKISPTSKN